MCKVFPLNKTSIFVNIGDFRGDVFINFYIHHEYFPTPPPLDQPPVDKRIRNRRCDDQRCSGFQQNELKRMPGVMAMLLIM